MVTADRRRKISSAKAVRAGQLSVEYLAKSKENRRTEKYLSIRIWKNWLNLKLKNERKNAWS